MKPMHYFLTTLIFVLALGTVTATDPIPFTQDEDTPTEKEVFLTAEEFSHLKFKDFKTLMGREKMTLEERIGFTLVKRSIRKGIRKGHLTGSEDINAELAANFYMNWGAFALGFLLSIIGVALVLLLFDDREAWKSALIGWAAWIVFALLFFI